MAKVSDDERAGEEGRKMGLDEKRRTRLLEHLKRTLPEVRRHADRVARPSVAESFRTWAETKESADDEEERRARRAPLLKYVHETYGAGQYEYHLERIADDDERWPDDEDKE